MTARATTQQCRIRLAPGRHVHAEQPRDCHVLLYPTGMVQLNECAAAILALCDGTRTREEISYLFAIGAVSLLLAGGALSAVWMRRLP